jgi:hypothetical protein
MIGEDRNVLFDRGYDYTDDGRACDLSSLVHGMYMTWPVHEHLGSDRIGLPESGSSKSTPLTLTTAWSVGA